MFVLSFFALLGIFGVSIILYASINLVKLERTLVKVQKRRELSKIETLKEIESTCKILKNGNTDNSKPLAKLEVIRRYIERYY
jgi:hypothetical protein